MKEYFTYNNIKVPKIGLGTWQLKEANCTDCVRYALDEVGYKHIDTAQIYGNEEQVGQAIADSAIDREDIFLTTKIWLDNMSGADVLTSFEASLKKLKTDYCDLVLVHWPHKNIPFKETLTELKKAQDQGKTHLIGVSNFTLEQVREARDTLGFDIATNQCEYHPYLDQSALIKQADTYGMFFTAYSPIAQGKVLDDTVIREIAEAHEKSPIQVTLRWLYQQKNIVAIPRSSKIEHIKSNFDIFDFELSATEMSAIFALTHKKERIINPEFAPEWDVAA